MAKACMRCVLLLLTLTIFAPHISATCSRASSIFIFGDSTADVGTNILIDGCTFNANNTPYGRDLPGGVPTGRWSNGFNTIDYLCKEMLMYSEGSPKPYMALEKEVNPDFEKGVNFASAGSGVYENTTGGKIYMNPMNVQFNQFVTVREKLATSMGEEVFVTWISKAIFLISIGSNDFIQYGLKYPNLTEENKRIGLKLFPIFVMGYTIYEIEKLYELGARKFAVISVLAMGCCPGLRQKENGECTSHFNDMSKSYMTETKSYLQELERKYKDFKYSFGDTYSMMMNVMDGKSKNSLKVIDKPCCEGGCHENATVCENPEEYAFWDDFHPTDTASRFMADALYNGTEASVGQKFVTPITFRQLVEENSVDDLLEFEAMFNNANF